MLSKCPLPCAWHSIEIKQIPPFPVHADSHAHVLLYRRVIKTRQPASLRDLSGDEDSLLWDVR